jgi:hypothetical protein
MLISITRTGGFAGVTENVATADTAALSTEAATILTEMVHAMSFFSLPQQIGGGDIGADLFFYKVTVTDGSKNHTVTFSDTKSSENASLHNLLEAIAQK